MISFLSFSVTKRIIAVRTVYFYNSSSILATKSFVTESVLKEEALWGYPGIIRSGKNVGWKMVYNFLDKDEKKTLRNLYLLSLKTLLWKEVGHFSAQCILTKATWLPTLIPRMQRVQVKMKKKTLRNLYLLSLKTLLWKEVGQISTQCILTTTTWLPTLIPRMQRVKINDGSLYIISRV